MSNLRRNNSKSNSGNSSMLVKIGMFAGVLSALFFVFNQFAGGEGSEKEQAGNEEVLTTQNEEMTDPETPSHQTDFYPTSSYGEIVERTYYALSYAEKYEQAEWVAYELTKESLQKPNVERTGDFRPDPKIRKGSSSPRDFRGSGYDRGHLVPAGDMAFSQQAMSETFYMTNISPQIKNFNGGIWRELEENVRNWAYNNQKLYVVTGPILSRGIRETIGNNEVAVPDEYYKVILDYTEPEYKAIGFIMPNEVSYEPIIDYAVSIDEIEKITGIDFFYRLLPDDLEELLEGNFNPELWNFDKAKELERKKYWNKRR